MPNKSALPIYLTRIIDKTLVAWAHRSERSPLLLRGARQVGKTATIRKLGETFSSVAEVNFEREHELNRLFEKNLEPRRILKELEIHLQMRIVEKETLLFFDEIQECPKAILSLRYFYEEIPQLHIIAAGSLLEFAMGSFSFPVGRIESEYQYPLSFSEFLLAMGDEMLLKYLPRPLETLPTDSLPETASKKFRERLQEYLLVGGMPKVVAEYRKTSSIIEARRIQNRLVENFQTDMQKYVQGEKQLVSCEKIFPKIFQNVGKEITYSHLNAGDDYHRTKTSLALLEKAMVVHIVRSVQPAGLPLGAEASEKHFKMIFLDVGLGQCLAGVSAKEITESINLLHLYEGRLAEQFVGQQLLAETGEGSERRKLYCWFRPEKSSSAEVDFVIARHRKVIPLEVKSGKGGRLKSLHLFLTKYGGQGICLQDTETITRLGNIIFAPLYSLV